MTDRFGFITYKMYVLQGTSLFLLFNSFSTFLIIKQTRKERERESERERERERERGGVKKQF